MVRKIADIVVIKRDGDDGKIFPLTDVTCAFGRSLDCDIRIQLPDVANQHCVLKIDDNGQAWIENIAKNATKVNGSLVENSFAINHKDLITISDRSFRFEYLDRNSIYLNKENLSKHPNTPGKANSLLPKGFPSAAKHTPKTNIKSTSNIVNRNGPIPTPSKTGTNSSTFDNSLMMTKSKYNSKETALYSQVMTPENDNERSKAKVGRDKQETPVATRMRMKTPLRQEIQKGAKLRHMSTPAPFPRKSKLPKTVLMAEEGNLHTASPTSKSPLKDIAAGKRSEESLVASEDSARFSPIAKKISSHTGLQVSPVTNTQQSQSKNPLNSAVTTVTLPTPIRREIQKGVPLQPKLRALKQIPSDLKSDISKGVALKSKLRDLKRLQTPLKHELMDGRKVLQPKLRNLPKLETPLRNELKSGKQLKSLQLAPKSPTISSILIDNNDESMDPEPFQTSVTSPPSKSPYKSPSKQEMLEIVVEKEKVLEITKSNSKIQKSPMDLENSSSRKRRESAHSTSPFVSSPMNSSAIGTSKSPSSARQLSNLTPNRFLSPSTHNKYNSTVSSVVTNEKSTRDEISNEASNAASNAQEYTEDDISGRRARRGRTPKVLSKETLVNQPSTPVDEVRRSKRKSTESTSNVSDEPAKTKLPAKRATRASNSLVSVPTTVDHTAAVEKHQSPAKSVNTRRSRHAVEEVTTTLDDTDTITKTPAKKRATRTRS